jgi:hypothetical protein
LIAGKELLMPFGNDNDTCFRHVHVPYSPLSTLVCMQYRCPP